MKLKNSTRLFVITSVSMSMMTQILLTPTLASANEKRCIDALMKKAAAEATVNEAPPVAPVAPSMRANSAPQAEKPGLLSKVLGWLTPKEEEAPPRAKPYYPPMGDNSRPLGQSRGGEGRPAEREADIGLRVGDMRREADRLRDEGQRMLKQLQSRNYPRREGDEIWNRAQDKLAQAKSLEEEAARLSDPKYHERLVKERAEREERERTWREQEEQRRREREAQEMARRQQMKERAEKIRGEITQILRTEAKTPYAIEFIDGLAVSQASGIFQRGNTVFLAVGHPTSKLTPNAQKAITELVRGLIEQGHRVAYDADSAASGLIGEVAGDHGVGISGRFSGAQDRVIGVQNPVRRMTLLLSAKSFVVTPDSVLGTGLLIEGQAQKGRSFHVLDFHSTWRPGLSDWKSSTFKNEYGGGGSWSRRGPDVPARQERTAQDDDRSRELAPRPEPVVQEAKADSQPEGGIMSRLFGRSKPANEAPGAAPSRPAQPPALQQAKPIEKPTERLGDKPVETAKMEQTSAEREGLRPSSPAEPPKPVTPSVPNLGIEYGSHTVPFIHKSIEKLLEEFAPRFSFSRPDASPFEAPTMQTLEQVLKTASDDQVIAFDDYSKNYELALQMSRFDSSRNSAIPGGAAVLGSAKGSQMYEKLVYDCSLELAELGFPIATGGSGGFMETANRAATQAGAYSLGIPRGGLPSETRVATDVQNITINTPNYEMRIPVILDRRELVVLAPGGSGTMKELAVHLVARAAQDNGSMILLIGGSYYKELGAWLSTLPMPETVRNRIHVIDSREQLRDVVKKHMAEHPNRLTNMVSSFRFERPKPKPVEIPAPGPRAQQPAQDRSNAAPSGAADNRAKFTFQQPQPRAFGQQQETKPQEKSAAEDKAEQNRLRDMQDFFFRGDYR